MDETRMSLIRSMVSERDYAMDAHGSDEAVEAMGRAMSYARTLGDLSDDEMAYMASVKAEYALGR